MRCQARWAPLSGGLRPSAVWPSRPDPPVRPARPAGTGTGEKGPTPATGRRAGFKFSPARREGTEGAAGARGYRIRRLAGMGRRGARKGRQGRGNEV